MDMIWLMLGGFVFLFAGTCFIIWRYVASRFPPILIRTKMRGTVAQKWYRTLGDVIVQDDIVSLLLGKYTIYGFKSWLEYDLQGGKRIYNGYLYKDFIFSMKDKPIEGSQKIVFEGEDKKGVINMKFSKDMILPVKYNGLNYDINGSDIQKGKDIAGKFITAIQQNDEYTKSTNPILMALVGILPSLLMVIAMFVGCYFVLSMVLDKLDVVLKALPK